MVRICVGNGAPMLKDGTRLLFNLATDPRQVSVKGGESIPLSLPLKDAILGDLSPDRTEFLIFRRINSGGTVTTSFDLTQDRVEFGWRRWSAAHRGGSGT